MKQKISFVSLIALSLVLPQVSFAADVANLQALIAMLIGLGNQIIPLFFLLALLAFFWGVIKYIYKGGSNPQEMASARSYMIYSIVGIAVMMSVWGLALFLKNSFFPSAPAPINLGTGGGGGGEIGGGGSHSGGVGDLCDADDDCQVGLACGGGGMCES